jgi:para-aminobenzoate synthetase/4-amino-4-deoxychorismate lyase
MTTLLQPDPTRGLFETLLVLGGEPIELNAHLDRLAASLESLFAITAPPDLAREVSQRADGIALGRLRVTVAGDGTVTEIATEDVDPADFFPLPERGTALRSLPCAGGLGDHKLADRRLLGDARGSAVPLLLDRGEEVLEAGRANVFVASDGVLVTPRADGRILPGTARAGAIAAAREAGIEVGERRLWRNDLLAADEVFLTGSVRGVEPARALDGAPLPAVGELSRLVGDGLRLRWSRNAAAVGARAPAAAPAPGPLAR